MLINIFLITHPLKFELLFIYSSRVTLLEFSVMSTIKKKKDAFQTEREERRLHLDAPFFFLF